MKKRPRLDLPPSNTDRALEIVSVVALAYTIVLPALRWDRLPERVPTHFDLGGEVTTWGPRATVWVLVGIGVIIYLGLTGLQRVPHAYNYPVPITDMNAARQYRLGRTLVVATKAWCLLLFAAIVHVIVRSALGGAGSGGALLWLTLGSVTVLIGGYMVLARRLG
jgi:hypothetical protein